jgi:Family of unknown function (DUF6350)
VATLLDPPRTFARVDGVLRALVGGLGAALAGLAVVSALVLIGWAAPGSASDDASLGAALRIAGLGWLAAHHVPLLMPSGLVTWLPLGLLVVPAAATFSAGRWIVRQSAVGRGHVGHLVAMSGTYAAVAAAVATASSTEAVHAEPLWAAAIALVVAGGVGGWGMWRAGGWDASPWRRVPVVVRTSVAAGVAGASALVGGGALLAIVALAVQREAVDSLVTALDAGLVGSALLLVLSAAYVPNIVVWAVAYAIGPGFAVGAGTSVSPLGVEVGPLPALPLLGALPPPGQPSSVTLLALLVPLAAGVVVGLVLARRLQGRSWKLLLQAAAAAGVAGMLLGVLAVLSGGPLGGGRLAVLGPSPWQVALAAALELAIVATPTAWIMSRAA